MLFQPRYHLLLLGANIDVSKKFQLRGFVKQLNLDHGDSKTKSPCLTFRVRVKRQTNVLEREGLVHLTLLQGKNSSFDLQKHPKVFVDHGCLNQLVHISTNQMSCRTGIGDL